jgi:hypothetical protein
MTLRRLLIAFLLSMVVGVFANSISKADSFRVPQLGADGQSSFVVVGDYDEAPTFSFGSVIPVGASISSAGLAVTRDSVMWGNTPLLARADAADTVEGAGGAVVRHYTTSEIAQSIADGGGYINPSEASGKIWLTTDEYADGASAQSQLALPRAPDGYFEIPASRVSGLSEPSTVEPAYGQPGGGTEMTTESPIDITDINFIEFGQ